ncbi:hypothetical protein WMF20_40145 [Sorangium sp. So ce834]|uniref:hypothetical protein n=1 Tax=Sorangium sp. So ce834 TaxID=3133321 RepID=UPI003F63E476
MPFEVEAVGTFYRVLATDDRSQRIGQFLTSISKIDPGATERVFAAQRYLHQALWLGYAARHPQQFAGERLLNLHKAIEVLYPYSGSIDNLRVSLAEQGLKKELVELFASLAVLRNSVDVGHVKLGTMTSAEFNSFHKFLLYTTQLTSWLIERAVESNAAKDLENNTLAKPDAGSPSEEQDRTSDLAKTMSMVDKWVQDVDPLKPATFYAADSRSLVSEYRAKRERSEKNKKKAKKRS